MVHAMKKTGTRRSSFLIRSTKDLVAFVDHNGMCYLFKKGGRPRVWDMVEEADATTRRGMVLGWSERAHLRKNLFLFVDESGSPLAVSWSKFRELFELKARMKLSNDEKVLMRALNRQRSTPELRKVVDLPMKRFDKALVGVRSKMRVALVDVIKESKTKHINCYGKIGKWHSVS
jgi:hypothetical protein